MSGHRSQGNRCLLVEREDKKGAALELQYEEGEVDPKETPLHLEGGGLGPDPAAQASLTASPCESGP